MEWFTERAQAVGLDFVHFNGMSGEFLFEEMVGSGVALLDFDNDGDLDVYFPQGQMLGADKTLADAVLPPQMPLPLSDRLYRNDLEVLADGSRTLSFTDVTEASGLDVRSYGMGVATGDIDNDGWVDLYRTRLGPDQLFRNNGDGTFADVTATSQVAREYGPAMGVVASDLDADGWVDLYLSLQTNTLYLNDGTGLFEDRSTMSGLGVPGPELNANYNVTELPDGTRLTGGQRISVDLLPPEVLFLPFARKTDMRVMRRFNIGNTQIAPVLDVFNIFNTTTSVNNTYGSRWQEISRIMQARYMRIGLELEW